MQDIHTTAIKVSVCKHRTQHSLKLNSTHLAVVTGGQSLWGFNDGVVRPLINENKRLGEQLTQWSAH